MATTEQATTTPITYDKLFLGGAWEAPAGESTIEVVSPSTEQYAGYVPEASETDADRAVAAARRAFDDPSGWATWTPDARGEALERLAVALEARGPEMARRVSLQNGMPISISTALEAGFPPMLLRYYAQHARTTPAAEVRPGLLGGHTLVTREPVGVVAAIVPWNFPQALTILKLAPLLAAGCTVVIKPAPETVFDAFLLAEAVAEADLPAGVVSVVPGGRELGAHLVSHPGVDKVAFTGSTAAGRAIGRTCGELLRPVTLELGGKSAAIVLDDADLASNLEALFGVTLMNNGQTCWLNSRILAPKSRYDDVLEVLSGLAGGVTIGDALDPATQIGPMTSARQRERVEGYIATGRAEGARVATGGGRPAGLDKGFFVEPTVFADVDNTATIAREEIFGPVLSVIPYADVDEAVAIANDSEYGLGGTVWTSDARRGVDVARRVRSGTIGINAYANDPTAPFGGIKSSGIGSELGPEGFAAYQQVKSIYLDAADSGEGL
ncbi:aldehyde dehydrogenase [Patulibacter minatonensis]|uniref:aldehyde dehydrogenase n=1 Tax=Patulibacter minatonensis TaxID=298163 RepID=UPI0004AD0066|nr:aldehyde dehydrogenase [Patulibacter minatonensis]